MKKGFKIFLICFVIGLAAFCVIAYLVNPGETTDVFKNIWNFLNQPLPIIGISIITISGFVMAFLKTTSIGQKGLNIVKEKYELTIEQKDETIRLLNEAKEKAEQTALKYQELNEKFNKMIDILPNKKLKELKDEEINEAKNEI